MVTNVHGNRKTGREKTGLLILPLVYQGIARTQSPTNKNYAPELPTFGAIARVSPTGVQWKGLALGEPPCRSRYPLCQVSMLSQSPSLPYRLTQAFVWLVCRYILNIHVTLKLSFQIYDNPLKHLANHIYHILHVIFCDILFGFDKKLPNM